MTLGKSAFSLGGRGLQGYRVSLVKCFRVVSVSVDVKPTSPCWLDLGKVDAAGLVGCVSRNGNLLLNVGPMEDGSIPAPAVERLTTLGDWYAANGESIFGCGKSKFTPPFGCAYTQKGDALYCHFLQTPLGDVILPGRKGKIAKMTLLRTGEEVPCIDQWGFELLKKDDQRIRPKGIVPGDVVKIVLSKE